MTLAAVSDDRYFLAANNRDVGIFVVVHVCGHYLAFPCDE